MQIHISRDGQSFGPYAEADVKNYLSTGHIRATDLAWHEGAADWKPLNTLPGFEAYTPVVPPLIPGSANAAPTDYHHVSFTKFIVFSLCSFGIYHLYWFYKNWKFVRDRDFVSISPFWRAVFSPIWYYSLSRDVTVAKGGDSNLTMPALVAVTYFALSMTWKLPDPYWLLSLIGFVPLLHTVWQIDQINRSKSLRSPHYSRFKIRHIFGCLIGGFLLVISVASTLNMIPSTLIVDGDKLPQKDLSFLQKATIITNSEAVLYFYSTGLFSIEDDGNLITTERVISYERDVISGELNVYEAAYKDIHNIEVTPSESMLEDTTIYIALNEDDGFYLLASAEEGRDKLFIDKLMSLWNEHKPKDAPAKE